MATVQACVQGREGWALDHMWLHEYGTVKVRLEGEKLALTYIHGDLLEARVGDGLSRGLAGRDALSRDESSRWC